MIELTGKTLADRYDMLALIGTGGMGAVYRARDREPTSWSPQGKPPRLRRDATVSERFRHEVKLARRVTHVTRRAHVRARHADGVMYSRWSSSRASR